MTSPKNSPDRRQKKKTRKQPVNIRKLTPWSSKKEGRKAKPNQDPNPFNLLKHLQADKTVKQPS